MLTSLFSIVLAFFLVVTNEIKANTFELWTLILHAKPLAPQDFILVTDTRHKIKRKIRWLV